MGLLNTVIFLVLPAVWLLYIYFRRKYSYWADRNVPQAPGSLPLGTFNGMGSKYHFTEVLQQVYDQYHKAHKAVGVYLSVRPILFVNDLDLVKQILVKDFNSFRDRGMYYNEKDDPLSAHLFSIEGEKWRFLRNKLSPTFTSGKIKYMFLTMCEIGDELLACFEKYVGREDPVDIKPLAQRFTSDVISSVAFGFKSNALQNEGSELLRKGDKVFKPGRWETIRMFAVSSYRDLAKKLGMRQLPKDVTDYFMDVITGTVDYREKNNVTRQDFLQLLLQLKNKGTVEEHEQESKEKITLDELAAQAFLFFIAGFDTTSTTVSFALFELASNPDVQEKARQEVKRVLANHDGHITYDALKDMTYLEQVVNETLRKHPPVGNLIRLANGPYKLDCLNTTLEPNTMIMIPVHPIHHDPEIYPNPSRFDPDRFTPEAINARHSHSFLPFGDGPRNCIGMRFGLVEVKFGIAKLLNQLRFTVHEKTQLPMRYEAKSQLADAKGGIWLNVERIGGGGFVARTAGVAAMDKHEDEGFAICQRFCFSGCLSAVPRFLLLGGFAVDGSDRGFVKRTAGVAVVIKLENEGFLLAEASSRRVRIVDLRREQKAWPQARGRRLCNFVNGTGSWLVEGTAGVAVVSLIKTVLVHFNSVISIGSFGEDFFEMDIITLVLAVFTCLSGFVYYFLRREQQQWSRLGVPIAKNPHLLYGNVRGIFQKEPSCEVLQRLYWEFKRRGLKLGGIMNFFQPAVLVVDPEISKSILVKDFHKFHNRGLFVDSSGDPLSASLFSLEGAQWKAMRMKMSPTFTSGKMKYMFGSVVKVADQLKEYVAENCTRENIELKNILQRYTMDVIGNVAFGVECNSIKNPSSEFRMMGLKANRMDVLKFLKFFIGGSYKNFAKKIKMKVVEEDVHNFFTSLIHSTVQYREDNGVQRNDFLDLLIKIKNNGKLSDKPNSGGEGITISEIAAQCFIFFTAGFDTSSTTLHFCLYELARNPNIQDQLRREIEESIAKDGGELKYDTLFGMSYLDRVVSETLRKYSPVDNLFRVSNSPYTPEGCDFTIPAGTLFQIPIHSMHHDPEYFPKPQRFDPDRFLPEVVKSRHPFAYLPFGEGPRICIGMRFGQMQTKIGLVTLLRNFRIAPMSETTDRLEFDSKTLILTARTEAYLKIEPIGNAAPVDQMPKA
ncbi:uncharacterized protein LOC134206193 [Armigeres subalbatus]|uniref:uncharacterized protein LOC134206193 n=1 Tax=Armigeres subalbatus TaxID=124917 RepID=UPI002ED6A456